jgi:hypothetical protein
MNLTKSDVVKVALVCIVLLVIAVSALDKLARGPSTKDEVCASFASLGEKASRGNGLIDNPIVTQAEDLSDVAGRYEGRPSLAADAEALERITASNTTSMLELMHATTNVARLCGRPLAGSARFGG